MTAWIRLTLNQHWDLVYSIASLQLAAVGLLLPSFIMAGNKAEQNVQNWKHNTNGEQDPQRFYISEPHPC